jgi:hypothetical protein
MPRPSLLAALGSPLRFDVGGWSKMTDEPLAREREPIERVRARLEALVRVNAAPTGVGVIDPNGRPINLGRDRLADELTDNTRSHVYGGGFFKRLFRRRSSRT